MTEEVSQSNSSQTWEEIQAKHRNKLLDSKPNKNLKSSLLEELYIRGLVNQQNDKYKFVLPFDLHGFDCGAPDCYSTDITFEISATTPIFFPKEISFHLWEHGCVHEEISKTGTFKLAEWTPEFVNYYSRAEQSSLLIFGTDKRAEFVYYFPDAEQDSIKGEMVAEILELYTEEDSTVVPPFRITTMLTSGYEKFLEN